MNILLRYLKALILVYFCNYILLAEEVAHYVGISDKTGMPLRYNAMDVIRKFGDGFLSGDLDINENDHASSFASYISFGKIISSFDTYFPASKKPLIRETAASPEELNDIFKTFLIASFAKNIRNKREPLEEFNLLNKENIYNVGDEKAIRNKFFTHLGWEDAKGIEHHIAGAAFLAYLAEFLSRPGYGPHAHKFSVKDLSSLMPHIKECMRKNAAYSETVDYAKNINEKTLENLLRFGFDPLKVLEEAKQLFLNQRKIAIADVVAKPNITHKINNECYMVQRDSTLYFVLEKLTEKNLSTWKKVFSHQDGSYHVNEAAKGDSRYKNRRGVNNLNKFAGTSAVDETYRVFEKRRENNQQSDFWVAYVFSTSADLGVIPTYPFQLQDYRHIETLVTVLSSDDHPFISYAGISQNSAHTLSVEIPEHEGNVKPLFAYVAHIMYERNQNKIYMINCPTAVIGNMLKKAWPDHVFISENKVTHIDKADPDLHVYPNDALSPLKTLSKQKGLELQDMQGNVIFKLNKNQFENSWLYQHQHCTSLGSLNPMYVVDLAFLASLYK